MKKTLRTTNVSRRKFIVGTAAAGGGLALGFKLPFIGSAEAATAAGSEVNAWVVVKPDSTCVVRIALGDGAGHSHRPRAARRRGARVRLEESRDRARLSRAEPRPQARLGRHGDRRQPRYPRLAGLCASRRRRGA